MTVEVSVLGAQEVVGPDGATIDPVLAQSKRFALLTFLILDGPHRTHPRDELLAMFWPELSEANARNALSQALHFLRRSLGQGALCSVGIGNVQVDPAAVSCDAVAFVEAVKRGDHECAVGLYRGALLTSFHVDGAPAFEEWLDARRRRLHERAVSSARALLARALAEHNALGALAWAEHAFALAPDDEAIARQVMILHATRGDRASAVRAFESFATHIATSLDLTPSAGLVALVAEIRDGAFADSSANTGSVITPQPVAPPAVATAPTRDGVRHSVRVGALAVAATMVIAVVVARGVSAARGAEAGSPAGTRLTMAFADSVRVRWEMMGVNIALSPDGSQLAYVGGVRPQRIYLRRINDLAPVPLAGTEDGHAPQFSSDGKSLAFQVSGGLKRITFASGRVELLSYVGARYSWGDGDRLVFTSSEGDRSPLRMSVDGGASHALTQLDSVRGETGHTWPHILPDGNAALFEIRSGTGGANTAELAAVRFADRTIVRLGIQGNNPRFADGHIVFGRTGGKVSAVPFDARTLRVTGTSVVILDGVVVKEGGATQIATSTRGTLVYLPAPGGRQIMLVDRDGRVTPMSLPVRAYLKPRFASDGERIAGFIGDGTDADVWSANISGSTITQLTHDGRSRNAEWSADGKRIAWVRDSAGHRDVRWQLSDGTGMQHVLARDRMLPVFSADGRFFTAVRTTGDSLAGSVDAIPLDASQPHQRLVDSGGPTMMLKISRDGRWIAYVRDRLSDPAVYVQSIDDTLAAHRIKIDGGTEPVWGATSAQLYYRAKGKFIEATIERTPRLAIARVDTLFDDAYLSMSNTVSADYDVSRDGKRFVVIKAYNGPVQPVVVFGWRVAPR